MAEAKWRYSDGRQPPPVSMNLAIGKRTRSNYEIALYFSDRSCSYFEKIGLILILAFDSLEAINSASSVTQTLSREVADSLRKLIALAAARGNSSAVNPQVTQLTNGLLGGLHEKRERVKCVVADDSAKFGDTPQLAEQLPSMLLSLARVLKRSIQCSFANNVGIGLNIIKVNICNYRSANVW
ncbi:enhancer of mRNA-decapping protein 4-like [Pyrus ussuriensis x Pyrus communis]|uniref:Enhancer of mRNA-decapping protein 4-like n=1 Tax=Pyrus ussuriensis x Pyrus communis TaxID=2448454 RepID=A0A5N5HWM4_9ROSA|nr:enhancer of mRNA-decapping protein 4-like [Pyrus ussuriensis x Pyrus communis]